MVVTNYFDKSQERKFISALKDRVGESISINIEYVEDIPREKGGKFSIVKNNLAF